MRKTLWLGMVSATAFSYLYLSQFNLSGVPLFRAGDQDFFWTYANEMSRVNDG